MLQFFDARFGGEDQIGERLRGFRETRHRRGYRFVASVRTISRPAEPASPARAYQVTA